MTEKKFMKMIKEHPYLLDDMDMMPRSYAKEVYHQNKVSIEDFVAGVKLRLPPEAWTEYDRALTRIKRKDIEENQKVGPYLKWNERIKKITIP